MTRKSKNPKSTNYEFARLLSKGVRAIANRQEKLKGVVQDEIGYELGRNGRWAVQYWEQGHIPGDEEVETLARLCVTQGGMDKSWLINFLQIACHPSRKNIVNVLFPEISEIQSNLPRQNYAHFIGRERELEQIAAWLDPSHRAWILVIDGIGGIGKSVLAFEAAQRLLKREPPFIINTTYDAIIWVSAKQDILTPNGLIPRPDFFTTLDDIYTTIGEVLGRQDILQAQPNDQGRLVKRILSQKRVLLIVDNLENVTDKTVLTFLLYELPPPSKALVTTRERIYQAEPIRLRELDPQEGKILIEKELERTSLKLNQDEKNAIYGHTSGIPLVIHLMISRIATGFPLRSVLADLDKVHEDLVEYCVQSSFTALKTEDARSALLALSLFAVDAGYEALKYVAGFADDSFAFEEALVQLHELSLIDELNTDTDVESQKRFTMLPPTRIFAYKLLAANPNLNRTMTERQVDFYLETLGKIGYDYAPDNWQKLSYLDIEIDNLFELMTRLYESKAWRQVIQFLGHLYGYLSFHSKYWSEYLKWVQRAITAGKSLETNHEFDIETQKLLGWCLSEQCWIQINQEKLDEAEVSGEQALALFRPANDLNGEARVLRHLGLIERHRQNLRKAEDFYQKALAIWESTRNEREIASIYNNLGHVALQEQRLNEAEELLLKSLEIKEKLNDIPRLGNTLYCLGEVHFFQGGMIQAKNWFERALQAFEGCNDIFYQAETKFYLAKILCSETNIKTGVSFARDSLKLYGILGTETEHEVEVVTDFLAKFEDTL